MPLIIVKEDITKIKVNAVVCPTDKYMSDTDGLFGRVYELSGESIERSRRKNVPLGLGEVALSNSGALASELLILVSVPKWKGGLDAERLILRESYVKAMAIADEYYMSSIAIPLIGADGYGYPKDEIYDLAVRTISECLEKTEVTVYLCIGDKSDYEFNQAVCEDLRAIIDDEVPIALQECSLNAFYDLDFNSDESEDVLEVQACVMQEVDGSFFDNLKRKRERISQKNKSLIDYLAELDKPFQEKLFALIDAREMTDVECYKKANVDRRTFSKIKSNANYQPSKQTAVAFAIALQLDLNCTQELLASAGYTLSQSKIFDKIIRYFIHKENYDVFEINQALFEFDQPLLGSV